MKKQDIKLCSLVDRIERGELQLPEIQRRCVWHAPRVRDLLDSSAAGRGSGARSERALSDGSAIGRRPAR